jgi:hypothetical protein
MTIAFWIVAGINALLYLGFGGMKLARSKSDLLASGMGWTENVSPTLIRLVGVAEVLGAVGLIMPIALGITPILSPIAGACLTIVMAGAVIIHLRRREPIIFQAGLAAFTLAATVLAALVAF